MTAISSHEISELTAQIYQGVLEPSPWKTLLNRLCCYLRCEMAMMVFHSEQSDRCIVLYGTTASAHAARIETLLGTYQELASTDPLKSALNEVGAVQQIESLQGAISGTDFRSDFLHSNGIEKLQGLLFARADGWKYCLYMVCGNQTDANDDQPLLLKALQPHLEKSLKLYGLVQRHQFEKIIYQEALNKLAIGVIILDGHGHIMETNTTAQAVLDNRCGLVRIGNKVHAVNAQRDKEFTELLRRALTSHSSDGCHSDGCRSDGCHTGYTSIDALHISSDDGHGVGLLLRAIKPVAPSCLGSTPHVVIYIASTSQQKQEISTKFIELLFGLTASEAKLTALLTNGHTLSDAAKILQLTENSVRTYVKNIFSKLGVNRQAELIRLILNSVAVLTGDVAATRQPAGNYFDTNYAA